MEDDLSCCGKVLAEMDANHNTRTSKAETIIAMINLPERVDQIEGCFEDCGWVTSGRRWREFPFNGSSSPRPENLGTRSNLAEGFRLTSIIRSSVGLLVCVWWRGWRRDPGLCWPQRGKDGVWHVRGVQARKPRVPTCYGWFSC